LLRASLRIRPVASAQVAGDAELFVFGHCVIFLIFAVH
jgi:hypothetical protein